MKRQSELSSVAYGEISDGGAPLVILLPVGSVEPHGPHLPLGTDTFISIAAAERAACELQAQGLRVLIADPVPYGVTDFAAGFPGAISVPAAALTAFLQAIVKAQLASGATHVCLINNHLEPAQDQAIREVLLVIETGRASVACPLTRRWARTLSAEFKSGACHAGQYETSLTLAARPELVDQHRASQLAEVAVSLSDGIRDGKFTFLEMGMSSAYAGAPAAASAEEGQQQLALLAAMVVGEVTDALARMDGAARDSSGKASHE